MVLCVFGVILGPFGVGKLVWGVSRILSSMSQYCRVLVICFFMCFVGMKKFNNEFKKIWHMFGSAYMVLCGVRSSLLVV